MGKPKHRRCEICNVVTSRYARTERQGAVVFSVWIRDPEAGEVVVNSYFIRCNAHAGVK